MSNLDEIRKNRIRKLKRIESAGINPYPTITRRTLQIKKALEDFDRLSKEARQIVLAGRLMSLRGHGGMIFSDIQDGSGRMQAAFKKDKLGEKGFGFFQNTIDIGDFLELKGGLFKTKKGEKTLAVEDFRILAKSFLPLPEKWHGLKDVEERYRKRYLDLIMNPEVRERFEKRSAIIEAMRRFMLERGFMEVETPTLQPIYGGGFAKPFITHHNALNADFYLRISDEMYLKRLIVGGFEKVFEITKVFRNEGIDRDHNPEFTMFEAQIAFKDYKYGMDIIEEMIEYIALNVFKTTKFRYQGETINFKRPWKRLRLVDAVREITGLHPLGWESLAEARKAIAKLGIVEEKTKELKKMRSLGEMISFVFEEAVEEKLIQPTIVYDYPVEVSPLAKKCRDPKFTQRFEVFAVGSEIGNNYTELNDPRDLKKRFIEQKKKREAGFKEALQTDLDYLEAIEHGFPPTCGLGLGVDRLVMLLTNALNIKETIFFPTMRKRS